MGFLSAPSSSTFSTSAIFSSPAKKIEEKGHIYSMRRFCTPMVFFKMSYNFGFYSRFYYTNGVFLKDVTIRDFIARLAIRHDSAILAPRDSRFAIRTTLTEAEQLGQEPPSREVVSCSELRSSAALTV